MQFLFAAKLLITHLPQGDAYRLTLEYLLRNGVGRANACSQPDIVDYLKSQGVDMSVTKFQQTILKRSRAEEVFIASSSQGCFLIADKVDAITMREFYKKRIQAESRNLRQLKKLSRSRGWAI